MRYNDKNLCYKEGPVCWADDINCWYRIMWICYWTLARCAAVRYRGRYVSYFLYCSAKCLQILKSNNLNLQSKPAKIWHFFINFEPIHKNKISTQENNACFSSFSAIYMPVYSALIKTHHVRFCNGTMINVHFWYSCPYIPSLVKGS